MIDPSDLSSNAPGSRPVPDQQGDLDTCTRHALGKGIVAAFDQKMAVPGKKIDLRQNSVTDILLNEHNDGDGKWPTDFHLKEYTFRDKKIDVGSPRFILKKFRKLTI